MIPTIGTTNAGQAVSTDSAVSAAARGQSGGSGIPVAVWPSTAAVGLVVIVIVLSYVAYRRRKKVKRTKKQQDSKRMSKTDAGDSIADTVAEDEYYSDSMTYEYYETPPSAAVPKSNLDQSKSTHL